MVNLRHPDNIFYDREGDLFIITTDLDGRQEVVCKTNLECVSDVLARLLDINFKKVCDRFRTICVCICTETNDI